MSGAPAYDHIGLSYAEHRRADPRIAARIRAALGDARSVVNVGAGSGSYEPGDCETIAVEPSPVMIAQRPTDAAPAVGGVAEALPLEDKSVDAALGVLTIHHWDDLGAGIAEMRRVTRRRIVLFTIDAEKNSEIWTLSEYFPAAARAEREKMPSMEELEALLPGATIEVVPAPSRCRDEFTSALWDRPELFLDPGVLLASSLWHSLPPAEIKRGQERLRSDLESGRWDEKYGHLRTLPELDIGLRIVRQEL
jgi:ubiquinone/menaquinone biosynthesis C-methylase UbiE